VTGASEGESESTWARLTRSKVVQWGIAYAAAAWGFLQGIGFAADTFYWPDAIKQVALLLLLIGLAVVLVLAWYHGDRGETHVTRTELAMLTLLFLLGGGLFWRYQHAAPTTTAAISPTTIAPAAVIADNNSIAVLPFVNMSDDKANDYFSDGLSEELLNLLAQVPQLRVIARTSSFSFKGKEVDVATIAKTLNVAHVLEGSVRKSGDTLRITAQLIRAADSSHLWSHTYDRELTDVFKVQDEIAGAVVEELKIRLLGTAPKSHETDPRSYLLFLQARDLARRGTPASSKEAIAKYQQALEIDPTHNAARVGLANAYWFEAYNGWRPPDEGVPLARSILEKVLALDPENAPAHSALAAIAVAYDLDYAQAVTHIERALAQSPRDPDVIGAAGYVARRLGRMPQAVALFKYQVAQDPLNWVGHDDLALAYWYGGRLDEALAEFRNELVLSPDSIAVHAPMAEVYLQKGDLKSALKEAESEPDEQWRLPVLTMVYHKLGRRAESSAALAELIDKYERTSPVAIANVLAIQGDEDGAFDWLEKAAQSRDLTLGSTTLYPGLISLHSDARWSLFLRKHGMAPEQLAAIKFDVKVPD
jgi:TolB-like protein/Flp pilus assembly protein TadD